MSENTELQFPKAQDDVSEWVALSKSLNLSINNYIKRKIGQF